MKIVDDGLILMMYPLVQFVRGVREEAPLL